ncbi:MAG: metalloregulator ArsR/SmtB family transcription factor [Pirellulales bacterium]
MKKTAKGTCGKGAGLASRNLLSAEQALGLQTLFKVLANDTRLRILHAIVRSGELCVTSIADSLAMKPQAVSNQLQRLSDLGILSSRRDGNNMVYRVRNECVEPLVELALCLTDGNCSSKRSG